MGDAGDGWQTVMPTTQSSIERLSQEAWAQLEACELQILREWEQSHTHWSGIGKHIPLDDHTEAKKIHLNRIRVVNDTPLGTGSFGVVQKVRCFTNNKPIHLARKQVRPPHRRFPIQLLREEASVMEKLDHDHIVKLVGTYCIRTDLYLLLWPVAVCNLDCLFNDIDHLKSGEGDREDTIRRLHALELKDLSGLEGHRPPNYSPPNPSSCPLKYLQQIMGCVTRAVAYCHQEKIRHLDLKPSNILLNPGRVYLADFGIAKDVGDRDHTMTRGPAGTPKWRAPELNQVHSDWSMQAAEVYSLGLVLMNIATVVHGGNLDDFDAVIGDLSPRGRAEKVNAYLPRLEALALATQEVQDANAFTFSPRHAIRLISRMLDLDPTKRPTIFDVDAELVELGGLDQVYHSSCCKMSSRFVADRMNSKVRAVVDERDRLRSQHNTMVRRLEILEAKDVTYESRIMNEGKRHAENVAKLQALYEKEKADRKRLEAQVAELQQLGRRQHRPSIPRPVSDRNLCPSSPEPSGLMMRSRPRTHPLPNAASQPFAPPPPPTQPKSPAAKLVSSHGPTYSRIAAAAIAPKTLTPPVAPRRDSLNRIPSPATITTAGPVTPGSPSLDQAGFPLRSRTSGSRLPRAVNPSTPIRSGTPIIDRDPSSTDSTSYSMTSSVFSLNRLSASKLSLAETSVAGTPAIGTPAVNGDRRNSSTGESFEHVESAWADRDTPHVKESGFGLGIIQRRESVTSRGGESVRDTASVVSSVAPGPTTGTASSVVSGSALSSPRAAHATLDGHRLVKIPPLPTAQSWADVARRERRVQA
ncbi:kinase-like domain-containing protein [Podospora australis]|uniref:non-specific serine/threonine protein kinase n=1 Tax=Podospora australis TaxID=1536484 RepID=A0AAN6X057_9PEZI|nr:kinase-like domain-containing protein [Podospora australis]